MTLGVFDDAEYVPSKPTQSRRVSVIAVKFPVQAPNFRTTDPVVRIWFSFTMSTSNEPTDKQLRAAYGLFLADPAMAMHAEFVQTLVQRLASKEEQLTEKQRALAQKDGEIENLEKIVRDLRAAARFSGLGSYR